jgi:hypothetical protein
MSIKDGNNVQNSLTLLRTTTMTKLVIGTSFIQPFLPLHHPKSKSHCRATSQRNTKVAILVVVIGKIEAAAVELLPKIA